MTNPDPIKKIAESPFMKEFREFINRGNIMDLAIGVAVGGAFTAIVKSLVDDMIMPIASLLASYRLRQLPPKRCQLPHYRFYYFHYRPTHQSHES